MTMSELESSSNLEDAGQSSPSAGQNAAEEEVKVAGLTFSRKFGYNNEDSVETLPDGRIRYLAPLGDTRKATTSVWGKIVTAVDTKQKNGYAFQGQFLRRVGERVELILAEKQVTVVIVADGSWKHPHCYMDIYVNLNGILYKSETRWSNLEGDKIVAIADVYNVVREVQKPCA